MKDYPDTREEWQALFDAYFPDNSGVLLTLLDGDGGIRSPDVRQMVGWTVYLMEYEDDTPQVVVQDIYDDYPFHLNIESVKATEDGHVLEVIGHRPGPYPGDRTVQLSNRLTDEQRGYIAARKEHGW